MLFDEILNEIKQCEEFNKLSDECHHGITRMEHTLRVSRNVYKYGKKMNIDYVSATRAALLHDFFLNEDFGDIKGIRKGIYHPGIASNKAQKYFKLNKKEINAIESHMFSLKLDVPKYKEGWLLTLVDKIVAIYELGLYKFNPNKVYRPLETGMSFLLILLFNIITIGHK